MADSSFKLGLGSWDYNDHQTCVESVKTALDLGYRHIDTAQFYGTESWIGDGLAESPVPRDEVFLATKVKPDNLTYEDVISSTKASCERLGVEAVDLLYIHWPLGAYDPPETLAAFNDLHADGVIKHVGLSNFTPSMLDEAMTHLEPSLFAHQAEMHPLLKQPDLLEHARTHDYWFVAYSPIIRGEVFNIPVLTELAEKHDATPAQISIAWLLAQDHVATVPKATGDHIAENWNAQHIDLSNEDMEQIAAIEREFRVVSQSNVRITDEPLPWNRD